MTMGDDTINTNISCHVCTTSLLWSCGGRSCCVVVVVVPVVVVVVVVMVVVVEVV